MTEWAGRAAESWQALDRRCAQPWPTGVRVHEPGRFRVVFAWPLSQVLHAAVLLTEAGVPTGRLSPNEVWRSFRRYRRADGFLDCPVIGKRYYDDNAWIGLACAQRAVFTAGAERARWLRRAERSLAFVNQAVAAGGGVRWVEGGENLHACSTGSAAALAAAVSEVRSADRPHPVLAGGLSFLAGQLTLPDGLIADHVAPGGHRDDSVFTYNQGLAIRMMTAAGDLAGAEALARATLNRFDAAALAGHAACFNAIFFRALLHLAAVTRDDSWRRPVEAYLSECWEHGRDDRGLLTDVGRYDRGVVLDHAALTGLMAAVSLARADAARLA